MLAEKNVSQALVDLSDNYKTGLRLNEKEGNSDVIVSTVIQQMFKPCDSASISIEDLTQALLEKHDQLETKLSFISVDSFDAISSNPSPFDLKFYGFLCCTAKYHTAKYHTSLHLIDTNFYHRNFLPDNRIIYSRDLKLHLQAKLSELGIPFNPIDEIIDNEDLFISNHTIYSYNSSNEEQIYAKIYGQLCLKNYTALIEELAQCVIRLWQHITTLRRLISEAIRLQFISNYSRNRISRNPNPQKKEPPIGGVKIGGEQLDILLSCCRDTLPKKNLPGRFAALTYGLGT